MLCEGEGGAEEDGRRTVVMRSHYCGLLSILRTRRLDLRRMRDGCLAPPFVLSQLNHEGMRERVGGLCGMADYLAAA